MICKLCKNNEANKKNSDIIPKFLGKRLFEGNSPRYSLQIDTKGKTRQLQDTPKEDYIFCENCEKRISILETFFARKIISINDYGNRANDFDIIQSDQGLILKCKRIAPLANKLFFYSILWRVSISQLPIYKSFKLPNEIEVQFSSFLNNQLKPNHKELIKSFNTPVHMPKYHFIIFKPIVKNQFSRGVFTPFQASEDLYVIFTPDMAIYLYTKEETVSMKLKEFTNYQDDEVFVSLCSIEQWKKINQFVITKLLN